MHAITSINLGDQLAKKVEATKEPMNVSEVARMAVAFAVNWLEKRRRSHPKESEKQRVRMMESEIEKRLS